MSDDLQRLLRSNAPEPKRRLDVDGLLQEGMRQRKRRLITYSLAMASVVIIAGLITVRSAEMFNRSEHVEPVFSPAPENSHQPSDAFENLGAGWHELPLPPEVRTSGPSLAWTGRKFLVWGGYRYTGMSDETSQDTGFVYDADEETWRAMAESPLAGRSGAATVWTGRELLIWGGTTANVGSSFDDGAAYDPVTDSWRELPKAPLTERAPLSVWTGDELLVWGNTIRVDEPPLDGAAYDPETNRWRRISDAPIELTDATAAWTGREMIVLGAALHGGNQSDTETAIAAAYDPENDSWRRLPDPELSPQASTAAWNGTELIAWDYGNQSAAFDPRTGSWRTLPDVPIDSAECTPQSSAVEGDIFGDYCGRAVVFDSSEDAWRIVPKGRFTFWGFALSSAEPVALLMGTNPETGEDAMLAYRDRSWGQQSPKKQGDLGTDAPVTELEDGRHFGYIKSVSERELNVVIDIAEFLSGDEAQEAAEEAGVVEEGEPVPNDYYILNVNPQLRRVPLAPAVAVRILDLATGTVATKEIDLPTFARIFQRPKGSEVGHLRSGYWVTIVNGEIVDVEEQYVP